MWIDPEARVGGLPLREVCVLLRKLRQTEWRSQAEFLDLVPIRPSRGLELLRALKSEGYLASSDRGRWGRTWHLSDLGYRVAAARLGKPFRRQTAQRHLVQFLQRVMEVRDDRRWPSIVTTVILFGSLLDSERESVGDVDLAVRLAHRTTDAEQHEKMHRAYIRGQIKSGRRLDSTFEQVALPEIDLYRYLRNRLPCVSLHSVEAESRMLKEIPTLTLYHEGQLSYDVALVLSAEDCASLLRRD